MSEQARSGTFARRRVVRAPLAFTGVLMAFVFCCLSLTPSLLPRAWYLQGAISGVTAAVGYAVGSLLGWLGRTGGPFRYRDGRVDRRAWFAVLGLGVIAIAIFGWLGLHWQQKVRRAMGMDPAPGWDAATILLVAVVVFAFVLLVSRLIRLGTRTVIRWLLRFVPTPVAVGLGLAVSAFAVIGFLQGFLFHALVTAANSSFGVINEGTSAGITQPTSTDLAGSPESLVPWRTLGIKGRDFVGTAPTKAELGKFAGKPAMDPIRVYVGLDSADSPTKRAALAVRELERTGAFNRKVLCVFTTTGTGWVDPKVVDALEYLYAGDTAVVATQYSFLPSWLSFLVDKSKATEAAERMIGAVRAKLQTLDSASRPRLLLFGESLGSYATETAFDSLSGLVRGADGALLEGPVNVNPIWNEVTDGREKGSPVWKPAYHHGDTVRFGQLPADLDSPAGPWKQPRIAYLQNATDPVVWWNFKLILTEPAWLKGKRGPDVSPDMRWYPFVTFWQVVADLAFATGVPEGHGHEYGSRAADGWAAVAPPPGWSEADTARLKALVARVKSP